MTELTGFNLCNAPGAGRALVGNGETGRAQSQRIRKSQLEYGSCSHVHLLQEDQRFARMAQRIVPGSPKSKHRQKPKPV